MNKKHLILLFIFFLTIFSLGIRLFRISEPNHKYFDEVYHVVTAQAYARNDPAAYDPFAPSPEEGTAYDWLHPPLAKLIQASSINILGDNPFAWRLPSAVFGTGIILATFTFAYLLFGIKTAIFASLVIAFENLNLVMSRITMNDVFVTFFILCSFILAYLYIRSTSKESKPTFEVSNSGKRSFKYLLLTSIFLGLALSSKWTGAYAIFATGLFIIFNQTFAHLVGVRSLSLVHLGGEILKLLSLLILIPFLIYLLSYGQFWLQGHSLKQFVDLHKQIWWYQNKRDLEHGYGTTPLYCVPKGLNGPKTFCPWVLDIRPVYYSYEQYSEKAGYIYALGNPVIFWIGFLTVIYLTYTAIKNRDKKIAFVLLGYYIFWVPWIFSPRIMFLSHYLPSIPFMAVSLGFFLNKLDKAGYRYVALSILALFIFAFFYFYSITSGYPIEISKIDKFMWISSWR